MQERSCCPRPFRSYEPNGAMGVCRIDLVFVAPRPSMTLAIYSHLRAIGLVEAGVLVLRVLFRSNTLLGIAAYALWESSKTIHEP